MKSINFYITGLTPSWFEPIGSNATIKTGDGRSTDSAIPFAHLVDVNTHMPIRNYTTFSGEMTCTCGVGRLIWLRRQPKHDRSVSSQPILGVIFSLFKNLLTLHMYTHGCSVCIYTYIIYIDVFIHVHTRKLYMQIYMKNSFPNGKWACNANANFRDCVLGKKRFSHMYAYIWTYLWRALFQHMSSELNIDIAISIFVMVLNAFWKRALHDYIGTYAYKYTQTICA